MHPAKYKQVLDYHRNYKALNKPEHDLLMQIYNNTLQRLECIIGGGLSYKNGQIAYTDQYKYLQIQLDTLLQQYNLEYRDIKHQEPISLQIELVDILSGKTTTISVPLYAKPLMSG